MNPEEFRHALSPFATGVTVVIGRLLATDLSGTGLEPLLHYRGAYAALAA